MCWNTKNEKKSHLKKYCWAIWDFWTFFNIPISVFWPGNLGWKLVLEVVWGVKCTVIFYKEMPFSKRCLVGWRKNFKNVPEKPRKTPEKNEPKLTKIGWGSGFLGCIGKNCRQKKKGRQNIISAPSKTKAWLWQGV